MSDYKGKIDCDISPRDLGYALSEFHRAPSGEGPLGSTWKDKPHRIVYDLIAAVKYYAMRVDELESRLEVTENAHGGIYCRDETIRQLEAQLSDLWNQSPIGEVTHSDVLPGDDGLYRHEFRSSERIGLQAELFARPGKVEAQEPVAWDVFERRIYGAPGETNHRVLWVEHYKRSDGTISSDLDYLLEAANPPGGISGGKTIHVRPLVYGD